MLLEVLLMFGILLLVSLCTSGPEVEDHSKVGGIGEGDWTAAVPPADDEPKWTAGGGLNVGLVKCCELPFLLGMFESSGKWTDDGGRLVGSPNVWMTGRTVLAVGLFPVIFKSIKFIKSL